MGVHCGGHTYRIRNYIRNVEITNAADTSILKDVPSFPKSGIPQNQDIRRLFSPDLASKHLAQIELTKTSAEQAKAK